MKVLGISDATSYDRRYVVEVTHAELAKVFNKGVRDDLPALKVGQDLNLGEGYDFRNEVRSVCSQFTTSHQRFVDASGTLSSFARMVASLPVPTESSK